MERLVGGRIVEIFNFFEHFCQDDAAGPNVDWLIIVFFKEHYFWRSVYSCGNVTGQRSILILKGILKHNNSLGNLLFNLF
jgi:hypothetical protein